MRHTIASVTLVIAALLGVGCSKDNPGTGTLDLGGAGSEQGTWPVSETGPVVVHDGSVLISDDAGNTYVCNKTTCAGKLLECGDCVDNDGDGKVDVMDRECLGPCDNTEGPALIAGVGGVTGSTCHVDCYFDYGNGAGNDSCWWDHQCDPLEPEAPDCTYKPGMVDSKFCPATQSPECAQYCLPFTPNGCDCFGCCTFPELAGKGEGGADAFVWIGAKDDKNAGTCTFADILDETKCPRCTYVPGCYNPCGTCELCLGKTTLPPECYQKPDGGTGSLDAGVPPSLQCPGGQQPCGLPGQPACASGFYCISGCCIEVTID